LDIQASRVDADSRCESGAFSEHVDVNQRKPLRDSALEFDREPDRGDAYDETLSCCHCALSFFPAPTG
jgi:hypothetical protein